MDLLNVPVDAGVIDRSPTEAARGQKRSANYQSLGDRNGAELQRVVDAKNVDK
jgi:hypothetical protein